ncbi:hypothetical protein [Anaerovibrio sp. RM50]|uniref:hypothetical protein n=1 Tax=Anaerovibrio sp. RM50 TaxID=1200557 RepID=UPI00048296D8|nr:hypothetical protein [Anaerovibrio sp. RM50]
MENINFTILDKGIDEFADNMRKSGIVSFAANPYYLELEGYKLSMAATFRMKWLAKKFTPEDIGSGKIAKFIDENFQKTVNNLAFWINIDNLKQYLVSKPDEAEKLVYDVFTSTDAEMAFNNLAEKVRNYDVVAALFFLRDRNQFMPLAPSHFDKIFDDLGIDFKTSGNITYENYTEYNSILQQIRKHISERLGIETSLLDTHSLLWTILGPK